MSYLGQIAVAGPMPMMYPGMMPLAYPGMRYPGMRYPGIVMGPTFIRKTRAIPGQPYQMAPMSSEQIEAELYKNLPKRGPAPPQKGTTPVKLIKTDTGLEVPEYLLKREAERKRLAIIAKNTPKVIPPTLAKVGIYAVGNPGKATLIALGIGYLCAELFA